MRCATCNKKTLMTFECKCNKIFCNKHRMPEDHDCTFDFKSHGKNKLKINNPKIINDKLDKLE